MSLSRKIRKNVARLPSPEQTEVLPIGQMLSGPLKGEYLALPLFGWVALRADTRMPLVMLALTLLDQIDDAGPKGAMQLELPFTPKTEQGVTHLLDNFGWDGRVWPADPGWPTGAGLDEEHLRSLMQSSGLAATFVFPPSGTGVSALAINIARAKGPFYMPPLEAPEIPAPPDKVSKIWDLIRNPGVFYPRPNE